GLAVPVLPGRGRRAGGSRAAGGAGGPGAGRGGRARAGLVSSLEAMNDGRVPEPRPGLRTVGVYEPPQPQVPVRLNTNECPYPLPPASVEDLAAFLRDAELHRYPDREAREVRGRLAERLGVGPEGLWVASGSNEILQQVLLAYGGPGRRALVFEPTYHMYARLAWITHTEVERVQVEAPFVLGPDATERARAVAPV